MWRQDPGRSGSPDRQVAVTGRAVIVQGDALHLPLPDESVDLIVTSPHSRLQAVLVVIRAGLVEDRHDRPTLTEDIERARTLYDSEDVDTGGKL
jgi:hypothetical protein